tara:strand:+ start:1049 stop:1402 length:354 start_codon:yes stop_codon:yes gene_type:complete
MAEEILERFRLSLMQDFLPIGIAIIERVKAGETSPIIDVFNTNAPFIKLRMEGESSAKSIRDNLDEIIPGLGNPAMPVEVAVEEELSNDSEADNLDELVETLNNIENRLECLEKFLK